MKFRHSLALIGALSLAILISGCGKKQKLPAELEKVFNTKQQGWLKIGIYGDPLSLNPLAHFESEHGQMLSNFVHASPLRKLEDGTFVPYLFDSYSIYRGASDAVILEGVWRNDLKWHDGTDFDPRDLEYTFELIKKTENQSPYIDLVDGIKSIASFGRGQRTRIVFTHDSRTLLDLLTIGIVPSHIVGEQKLDKATIEIEQTASDTWPLYVEQPVGLGPYKIEARQKGLFVELAPHQEFYDNASRPALLVRSFYDYQQLVTDFRGGRLNWINLPSMLAEQLETMKIEDTLFIRYPNPACMTMVFNTSKPALADKTMRQALDLLVDRKKILNQVPFAGTALYEAPFASSAVTVTSYDQHFAKALDLLDSLNWKDTDADGIRDKDGKKLELSLAFNEDNLLRRALAEELSKDFKRAGIELKLNAVTWPELVSQQLKSGAFDTALVSFTLPEFGTLLALLHSDARPKAESEFRGNFLNYAGVDNSELNAALEALDSMLEVEDAAAKRQFIAEYLKENRPVAFLFKPYDVGLYHAESGRALATGPIWNDVFNWKILFGSPDSRL